MNAGPGVGAGLRAVLAEPGSLQTRRSGIAQGPGVGAGLRVVRAGARQSSDYGGRECPRTRCRGGSEGGASRRPAHLRDDSSHNVVKPTRRASGESTPEPIPAGPAAYRPNADAPEPHDVAGERRRRARDCGEGFTQAGGRVDSGGTEAGLAGGSPTRGRVRPGSAAPSPAARRRRGRSRARPARRLPLRPRAQEVCGRQQVLVQRRLAPHGQQAGGARASAQPRSAGCRVRKPGPSRSTIGVVPVPVVRCMQQPLFVQPRPGMPRHLRLAIEPAGRRVGHGGRPLDVRERHQDEAADPRVERGGHFIKKDPSETSPEKTVIQYPALREIAGPNTRR